MFKKDKHIVAIMGSLELNEMKIGEA